MAARLVDRTVASSSSLISHGHFVRFDAVPRGATLGGMSYSRGERASTRWNVPALDWQPAIYTSFVPLPTVAKRTESNGCLRSSRLAPPPPLAAVPLPALRPGLVMRP